MRRTRTYARKVKILDEFHRSGLSQRAFCREQTIPRSTLQMLLKHEKEIRARRAERGNVSALSICSPPTCPTLLFLHLIQLHLYHLYSFHQASKKRIGQSGPKPKFYDIEQQVAERVIQLREMGASTALFSF